MQGVQADDFSRKSSSPLIKSKFSKMLGNLDRAEIAEEKPIDTEAETSEIASQLTNLRKRHDRLKESNAKKRAFYDKLKSELESSELSSTVYESDTKSIQTRIDSLKETIEETRKKYEDEKINKKSYLYVLERMKQEKLALEIKSNSLQAVLKESKIVLDSESDKFRKIRESQHLLKQNIQEIKQALALDQKRKQGLIFQLEKSIKERQELTQRREDRQKRQADISEAAANDDRDSHEAKAREVYLLNRFWIKFTKKKMKNEVSRGSSVESAFQQIKMLTGLTDTSEIIETFLKSEENCEKVKTAVAEAEQKLDILKKYNKQARAKLAGVQFVEPGSQKINEDIEEIEKKLAENYKENAGIKEKLHKAIVLYDQVLNWGVTVWDSLGITSALDVPSGNKVLDSKSSLEEMFKVIYFKIEDMAGKTDKNKAVKAIDSFSRKRTNDIFTMISSERSRKGKLGDSSSKSSEARLPKIRDKSSEN